MQKELGYVKANLVNDIAAKRETSDTYIDTIGWRDDDVDKFCEMVKTLVKDYPVSKVRFLEAAATLWISIII